MLTSNRNFTRRRRARRLIRGDFTFLRPMRYFSKSQRWRQRIKLHRHRCTLASFLWANTNRCSRRSMFFQCSQGNQCHSLPWFCSNFLFGVGTICMMLFSRLDVIWDRSAVPPRCLVFAASCLQWRTQRGRVVDVLCDCKQFLTVIRRNLTWMGALNVSKWFILTRGQ